METTPVRNLIGIGLYSLPEAARLLGVSSSKLRRWADGYTFRRDERVKASEPIIRRELAYDSPETPLTFADLIELKFISIFREHGVSMPSIRAAAREAARLFGTDHPFAVRRFDTDGKRIFATLHLASAPGTPADQVVEELAAFQFVFDQFVRPYFMNLEMDDEEVARLRPLGPGTRVVLDPVRSFGKPIDEESGVPTFVLSQMVEGGSSVRDVASWYEVDEQAVADAVRFEQSIAKAA